MGLAKKYSIGDNVSIACFTDLTFSRIVWLDADGALATNNPQSSLTLNSVTAAMNGAMFTCRAESEFGDQEMTISLVVMATGQGM